MRRSAARALFTLIVLALGLWGYARSGDRFAYAGTRVAAGIAPPLVLPDDRGGTFDLAAHRGRIVLVYFGYTRCPDVCPATLDLLGAVAQQLGADRSRVEAVFVTLDPRRDTPPALHDFLSNFDPVPVGLTGSPAAIAAAAQRWGVTWRPAEGGAYIDHTSLVTAIGPDGRQRLRYGFSQLGDAAAVARDLKHILDED
ncbi:MAG: SCO family protein [Acetobacteraceae bacterium]|nr:SCO family protein [Acetobacteraceae bacterium]